MFEINWYRKKDYLRCQNYRNEFEGKLCNSGR